MRNSRRSLLAQSTPLQPVFPPGQRFELFGIYAATASLAGASGRPCWCLVTAGMHALGQAEVMLLILKEQDVWPVSGCL